MSEPRAVRRLAAILATDIVGYSRLMEADESGMLARLKALRAEFLHPKVAEYGGRIVKTTGDGTLVEFPSAVDAVQHAVDVQGEMARRNTREPEGKRIVLRMGINLGDIIIDGDDIYGDGVNVAARLEALAEAGGICISGTVHEHVRNKLDMAFDDLGEQRVKNIARPVHVYRVALGVPAGRAESEKPALPLPDRPSIAVLPFANMSGDSEQEYFADGIAEDIITALSRFRSFFVIARNSSFTYKGRNVDVRQIGRELGVRYVLEGSVRRSGDQLRITTQLVEAATGNHLWAEKYDGALSDVFDLQDKITEGVVGAIEPSVRRAEIERVRAKRPDSLDAYDLYLRALSHFVGGVYSLTDSENAIALLKQALDRDPRYAAAHGLAARCYWTRSSMVQLAPADLEAATRHARAVLATDTDDANALAYAGFVFGLLVGDHKTARGAVDRALALNQNAAQAFTISAALHSIAGQFDQAIAHAQRSIRLSPFDQMRTVALTAMSRSYFLTGRFDQAVSAANQAITARANFTPAFAWLAASYVRLGRMAEAHETAQHLIDIAPEFRTANWSAIRFSPAKDRNTVIDALREAGLPE